MVGFCSSVCCHTVVFVLFHVSIFIIKLLCYSIVCVHFHSIAGAISSFILQKTFLFLKKNQTSVELNELFDYLRMKYNYFINVSVKLFSLKLKRDRMG